MGEHEQLHVVTYHNICFNVLLKSDYYPRLLYPKNNERQSADTCNNLFWHPTILPYDYKKMCFFNKCVMLI
jgi:hypothetical protein